MEAGRPYSRLLLRLERFSALSAEDRQRVADLPLKIASCTSDREVLSPGDLASRCTLVLDGFLYSHKLAAGSRRQITSFFVAGDIADLSTLYLPSVDYGITSLGSAVVAFVPHAVLKQTLDRSPSLTRAFWRESLMQAAIWHEWVANLGRRDALARIAHILCELTVRLQLAGLVREQSFSMPCTQVDIADACGISSVHANRVIQELRQLHVLEWDSRRVRILDWRALVRLGDFSGDYLQLQQPAPGGKQPPLSGQGVPGWI